MKQKIVLFFILSCLAFMPFLASARGLVPCGGYLADGSKERPCNIEDAFILVARVTNWLLAVAGVYAAYKIIGAGFNLITSMGSEEKITTNKAAISNAVVGFVLTLLAFLMVNTVVNVLIGRVLVTNNPKCKLDLTNPLTYLKIDAANCNGVQDSKLHNLDLSN